jgi:hypothetical protein
MPISALSKISGTFTNISTPFALNAKSEKLIKKIKKYLVGNN